ERLALETGVTGVDGIRWGRLGPCGDQAVGVVLELQRIDRGQLLEQFPPTALIGEQLDVLLGGEALVIAALGTHRQVALELLAQVDVAARRTLLPGIRRDLASFSRGSPGLSFFLEPRHYGHGTSGWAAAAGCGSRDNQRAPETWLAQDLDSQVIVMVQDSLPPFPRAR